MSALEKRLRQPKRTLDDLILPKEIRQRLLLVKAEFTYQKQLKARGDGLEPRNKFLFCGPPGNGKTATAEAVAWLMGLPILIVDLSELLGPYMNQAASGLGRVFEQANSQRCVLFADECDALISSRGDAASAGGKDANNTVNAMIMKLDRLDPGTVFIGATNLDENLDAAAKRRLGEPLYFPAPTAEQKAQYIERRIARMLIFSTSAANAARARQTTAPSFAELEDRINDLARELIIREAMEARKNGQKENAAAQEGGGPAKARRAAQKGRQEKGGAKAANDPGRRRRAG